MLQNIAIVPILILLTIIALLSIPLSINFLFMTKQGIHGYIQFNWLFGLIHFQTQFPDRAPSELSTAKHSYQLLIRKRPKKNTVTKPRKSKRKHINLLKLVRFRRHLYILIHRLLRAIKTKNLYLKLRIGLGDPADTGALWTIMGPLSGLLKSLNHIRLELEPEFIDATMQLESHGHFRFIPLQFILIFLVFFLSPRTIQAWRLSQP